MKFSAIFIFILFACKKEVKQINNSEETRVFFSPNGGSEEAIINAINDADTSISVAAYAFTSQPIINALKRAQQKGVDINFIFDYDFNVSHNMNFFEKIIKEFTKKSDIYVNKDYIEKQHNKFMIIDDKILLTGSYNYTNSAKNKNLENLLMINNGKVVNSYREEFERMKNNDSFSVDLDWLKIEKKNIKKRILKNNKCKK